MGCAASCTEDAWCLNLSNFCLWLHYQTWQTWNEPTLSLQQTVGFHGIIWLLFEKFSNCMQLKVEGNNPNCGLVEGLIEIEGLASKNFIWIWLFYEKRSNWLKARGKATCDILETSVKTLKLKKFTTEVIEIIAGWGGVGGLRSQSNLNQKI